MRGVHPVHAEGRGRVLYQRDVVPELHRESAGGFDARVGQQANHDDFGDPVLLQQHVEIGIRKAAGPPMFLDDNIARLRRKSGCHSPPQLPLANTYVSEACCS
jgi:hypothetical protein